MPAMDQKLHEALHILCLIKSLKRSIVPFKQDKASFILSVPDLISGHKKSNPQF